MVKTNTWIGGDRKGVPERKKEGPNIFSRPQKKGVPSKGWERG